jgi:DNA-binding NtrC family response regulator
VEYFLHRGGRSASITTQALTKLSEYHWPGNVRELENAIERAIVLAREGVVTENEIELRPTQANFDGGWAGQAPVEAGWETNFAELEKSLIERALLQAEGNKSKAADLLGIHRRLLYEKMRRHGLQ